MASVTCETGCDQLLQPVSFSECAPEVNLAEIIRVYVAKATADDFTDVTNITEWTSRLSDTANTDDSIRRLTVSADKPLPTANTIEISNNRSFTPDRTFVLNVTVDETNQLNYAFMQALQCGGTYKIWYETRGGYMYGGNTGIKVSVPGAGDEQLRGVSEIERFQYIFQWVARQSPDRTISPFSSGPAPIVYNTTLTFASAVSDTDQGVTGEVAATNPNAKLEFVSINPRIGTPASMSIKISGSEFMTVDFTTDYLGTPFKVTNNTSQVFTGTFQTGTVNF
jgi:hypothetical protein